VRRRGQPQVERYSDELLAAVGGRDLLDNELRQRLAEQTRATLKRKLRPKELAQHVESLADALLAHWQGAAGRIPRSRRDFPPETWSVLGPPEDFVKQWNERTWLHVEGGRGPITVDELLAEGVMAPEEFVDWKVDWWAWQLERATSLNCCDVLIVPPFVVAVLALVVHDHLDVSGWLAFLLALPVAALAMRGYVWLRRKGHLIWGDD
jgi:hypothetical protein